MTWKVPSNRLSLLSAYPSAVISPPPSPRPLLRISSYFHRLFPFRISLFFIPSLNYLPPRPPCSRPHPPLTPTPPPDAEGIQHMPPRRRCPTRLTKPHVIISDVLSPFARSADFQRSSSVSLRASESEDVSKGETRTFTSLCMGVCGGTDLLSFLPGHEAACHNNPGFKSSSMRVLACGRDSDTICRQNLNFA